MLVELFMIFYIVINRLKYIIRVGQHISGTLSTVYDFLKISSESKHIRMFQKTYDESGIRTHALSDQIMDDTTP